MEDLRRLLVLLLPMLLFFHPSTTSAEPPAFMSFNCSGNNYTYNSTYKANLDTLLSSLSSASSNTYGFYNLSVGQPAPDKVYGEVLCRGDVDPADCRTCLQDASQRITVDCPTQSEAVGWYGFCMIRFSNGDIFNVLETSPSYCLPSEIVDTDVNLFNKTLFGLLDSLRNVTASGNDQLKFATAAVTFTDSFSNEQKIYGLMQCTPDLSKSDCYDCLGDVMHYVRSCSSGKIGGQLYLPSCNVIYEQFPFVQSYNSPPPASVAISPSASSTSPLSKTGKRNQATGILIAVIAAPIVFSLVLGTLVCHLRKRRIAFRKLKAEIESIESLQFELRTIRNATNNFSVDSKVGQGGFATVYKGTLPNGQEIAVKRPLHYSAQGEQEFRNEVVIVAKLQHRNLVRLLGFCSEGKERLLIYEYLPNKSLDHFLFDPARSELLTWERRYRIIHGIARGLLYLHQDSHVRIVHRDLKAANILLDMEMNPKISDFGTARLFQFNQAQQDTTKPIGTYGYMPPEYALYGQFSVKSDIFSFGVLVLEILSGQKITQFEVGEDGDNLLGFAWMNWLNGTALDVVDPKLLTDKNTDIILRCINITLLCVQEDDALRPNMSAVIPMLSSSSISLPTPSRPAFVMSSESNTWDLCRNQAEGVSEGRTANLVSISYADPR
ncbi:Cysteine-rich receptor-like protein [Drosera capensis]